MINNVSLILLVRFRLFFKYVFYWEIEFYILAQHYFKTYLFKLLKMLRKYLREIRVIVFLEMDISR